MTCKVLAALFLVGLVMYSGGNPMNSTTFVDKPIAELMAEHAIETLTKVKNKAEATVESSTTDGKNLSNGTSITEVSSTLLSTNVHTSPQTSPSTSTSASEASKETNQLQAEIIQSLYSGDTKQFENLQDASNVAETMAETASPSPTVTATSTTAAKKTLGKAFNDSTATAASDKITFKRMDLSSVTKDNAEALTATSNPGSAFSTAKPDLSTNEGHTTLTDEPPRSPKNAMKNAASKIEKSANQEVEAPAKGTSAGFFVNSALLIACVGFLTL